MRLLLLATTASSVLGDNCTIQDAEALGNIDHEGISECMGSSISVTKLESCLKTSGVTISASCLSCLTTVARDAYQCGQSCDANPEGSACANCVESMSESALQCFSPAGIDSLNDPAGQQQTITTTTTKSSAPFITAPIIALAAMILA